MSAGERAESDPQTALDKYLLNDLFLLGPQAGVWEGVLSVDRRGQGKGTNWRKGQDCQSQVNPLGGKGISQAEGTLEAKAEGL